MIARFYATLAVSLLVTSVSVSAGSCEESLTTKDTNEFSSTEQALARIIHQMSLVKETALTPKDMHELDRLNDQALRLISAGLDKLGIAYRFIDPKNDPDQPNSISGRRKRYESAILDAEKEIASMQKHLEKTDLSNWKKKDLGRQIRKTAKSIPYWQEKIAQLDSISASQTDPSVKYSSLVKMGLNVETPYIVLEESTTNPPLINRMIKEYATIILSPDEKASTSWRMASVSWKDEHPKLFYSIEEIFGGHFGLNGTLLHELTHLHHAKKESQGINLPYYVRILAHKDETLHSESPGFYDQYMSFDELSAWNKDLNYVGSKALGQIKERMFDGGSVYEKTGDVDAREYKLARGLGILCRSGAEALRAAREQLTTHPESAKFRIWPADSNQRSMVLIPYIRQGRQIGQIEVTLVNLSPSNEADKMRIVSEYLDFVESRLQIHASNAKKVLSSYGNQKFKGFWVKAM